MIICGYAGIGKSYLAHNFPNIIDLESTPFEKDWDRYFKCAKHYSDQGFLVLLSCHKEIREHVLSMPYGERITIFPCIEDKELFRKRYEQRGNSEEFIKLQMDNWEKWTSENNRLLTEHLEYMESGETLYDTIIRLSKLSPNRFCTYDGCPVPDCSLMKDRCLNPLEKHVKRLATK
jgi:hypothetical protein